MSIIIITAINTLAGNEFTTAIIYPEGSSWNDFLNPDPPSSSSSPISSDIFFVAVGMVTAPVAGVANSTFFATGFSAGLFGAACSGSTGAAAGFDALDTGFTIAGAAGLVGVCIAGFGVAGFGVVAIFAIDVGEIGVGAGVSGVGVTRGALTGVIAIGTTGVVFGTIGVFVAGCTGAVDGLAAVATGIVAAGVTFVGTTAGCKTVAGVTDGIDIGVTVAAGIFTDAFVDGDTETGFETAIGSGAGLWVTAGEDIGAGFVVDNGVGVTIGASSGAVFGSAGGAGDDAKIGAVVGVRFDDNIGSVFGADIFATSGFGTASDAVGAAKPAKFDEPDDTVAIPNKSGVLSVGLAVDTGSIPKISKPVLVCWPVPGADVAFTGVAENRSPILVESEAENAALTVPPRRSVLPSATFLVAI